jgi:hypothetical protein
VCADIERMKHQLLLTTASFLAIAITCAVVVGCGDNASAPAASKDNRSAGIYSSTLSPAE